MKVLAAMSGGVDSAVAAARVRDAGHEVVGVHMALSRTQNEYRVGSRGCCTIEDALDARRVADQLDIPYYVWDLSEQFEGVVVRDFLAEYQAGRTPNPCVRCNERIKFETLLAKALALGFEAVCTGHYARILHDVPRPELHRAENRDKDQSYVLAVMNKVGLDHSLFPLGDVTSKAAVREEAVKRGFAVSGKRDSYDVCFIADGDTRGFLRSRLGSAPGPIVDHNGDIVGEHDGIFGFTIGQRKGLRLGQPASDGRPRYVIDVDANTNTITVGPEELLSVNELSGVESNWLVEPIVGQFEATAQVRAHGRDVPVTVNSDGHRVTATITGEFLKGVAAGQSMVLYRGTQVLGQATIESARRVEIN